MIIKTSKGTEFECEAITSIQTPPRLYLHLINTSVEDVQAIIPNELPIVGYSYYTAVQAVSSEGGSAVKVSLRGE